MGLEGVVSKRRDRPYRGGRSKHWVNVKNRKNPAINRVISAFAWCRLTQVAVVNPT